MTTYPTRERMESYINTWEKCYQVTLGTQRKYKKRLKELEEWDTCNNNEYEREVKTEALKRLIS